MGWFKNLISKPVKTILNSPSDLLRGTGRVIGDTNLPGSHMLQNSLEGASYLVPHTETFRQPMGEFAKGVNQYNENFPEQLEPYAVPIEAAVIGMTPAGPMGSAAFLTAMEAGNQQNQPDHKFDWNQLGRDAAVNFGTAYATQTLQNWANSGNAASTSRTAAQNATIAAGADTSPFTMQAGYNAAYPTAGSTTALSSFQPSSLSSAASAAQGSSGFANAFRSAAANAGSGLTNQALSTALTPSQLPGGATGLGGEMGILNSSPALANSPLSAFSGEEILKAPSSTEATIRTTDYNNAMGRISSQNALQRQGLMDQFMTMGPGVQGNSAYDRQVNSINNSTAQARTDYTNEANLLNLYNATRATNNLDDSQMQQLILQARQNPSWEYASVFSPLNSLIP